MEETNPIEDLRRWAAEIRAQAGAQPTRFALAPWVAPTLETHADHAERRERKALRRGLSTRYGQRRRQRAEGVAAVRHRRRQHAAWLLLVTIPLTRDAAAAVRAGGTLALTLV